MEKIQIWLTKGLGGERLIMLAEVDEAPEARQVIDTWKDNELAKRDPSSPYKIDPYTRFIGSSQSGVNVDFGDYSYFIHVTGIDFKEFCQGLN